MLPAFLLPETEVRESGSGTPFDLDLACEDRGCLVVITLGVTDIVEHQSLEVSIEGSEDGIVWQAKPLACFSQKFYCGTYQLLLNLQQHNHVRYLRPKWKVDRWGTSEAKPVFGIYVSIQEQRARVSREQRSAVMARGAA